MPQMLHRMNFTNPGWVHLTVIETLETVTLPDGTWVYAGSRDYGGIAGFAATDGGAATVLGSWASLGRGSSFLLEDIGWIDMAGQPRLIVTETTSTQVETLYIGGDRRLSAAFRMLGLGGTVIGQVAPVVTHAGPSVIAGGNTGPGLQVFELAAGTPALRVQTVQDTPKAALSDSADVITVGQGAGQFLLNAALGDGALSTFAWRADGTSLDLIDAIGVKEGLWASGLSALAAVSAAGRDFAVVAATLSSSLTLVRVNPMGVMFVAVHRIDDLTTRLAQVTDVAAFAIGQRGFVVACGADDGVSLFEITPDGRLLHLQAMAQVTGQTPANVIALTTATSATDVQIFVAGSGQHGLTQLSVPVAPGPEAFTSSPRDDLIWAGAGNDTLSGGDGADILMGGAGSSDWRGRKGYLYHGHRLRTRPDRRFSTRPGPDRRVALGHDLCAGGPADQHAGHGGRYQLCGPHIANRVRYSDAVGRHDLAGQFPVLTS